MLNFRITNLLAVILIILWIILSLSVHVSQYWLLVFAVIYLGLLVYGSLNICSGFYLRSICSVKTVKKEIALTFDDGPDENITPELLDLLKQSNASGCFFLKGENIIENKAVVDRINREGHLLGNHSFSHSWFYDLFSAARMEKEMLRTEKMILEITGRRTRFFRPPYGVTNPAVSRSVRKANYICIGWSIRSFDTSTKNGNRIIKKIIKKIQPGDIILFHDTKPLILIILPEIIKTLRSAGYEICRLDKLAGMPAYR